MSKFAKRVKDYYDAGIYTADMVRDIYRKGKITKAEMDEILGE